MFIKLFTQILDSSIADNRPLRHFFTDLMLCADCRGYVIMTESAIARRIGCTVEEVEWGIAELMKPDPRSKTPDADGARIERLDGQGYGWRVLNYESYRAMRDADQMREATKKRVRKFREKTDSLSNVTPCNAGVTHGNAITEAEAEAEAEAYTPPPTPPSVPPPPIPEDEEPACLPAVVPTGRRFPDHAALMRRIGSMRPEWARPAQWGGSELHALHGALGQFEELSENDWDLIKRFLAANVEKAAGYWQPVNRSKFVETFGDVFSSAQRWASKRRTGPRTNEPPKPIAQRAVIPRDELERMMRGE
jgi:hypothetical protein